MEHFTKIFRLAKLDAELSCHACQFRTGSVQWKNFTVFLAISRISGGVLLGAKKVGHQRHCLDF
jgi:hypothetical protein